MQPIQSYIFHLYVMITFNCNIFYMYKYVKVYYSILNSFKVTYICDYRMRLYRGCNKYI